MIALECRVSGVDRIEARLGVLPLRLRANLVRAIGESVKELEGYASAAVRRGKTGRTANSIGSEVREFPNAVRGTVYADWYIARFIEKGVSGAVKVKTHTRKRVPTPNSKRGGTMSFVRAYVRNVSIPAHPFMRPAWERGRSATEARIAAAVQAAAEEANR